MPNYNGKLLLRARDRLARRREEHAAMSETRAAQAHARIPELRETEAALRGLVGEVVRLTAERPAGAAAALAEVDRKSTELLARREALLAAHGYAADYLDEIVDCPLCGDKGYLSDGSMCDCLKALYEEERTREITAALQLGEETFADFDLKLYPEGEARECMELTLNTAREYAVRFSGKSPNLLFQGGTGLGKTFLSGCVAKVVSGRGFSVVYESAQSAFAAFEEQKFSRDAETYASASEKVRRILECELLILDDLGTELTTSFTQSALYNIVDTRLSTSGHARKTILSTNLSDAELQKRYIPQTVSRVSGEFDTLLFLGRDIRAIRKERRYL